MKQYPFAPGVIESCGRERWPAKLLRHVLGGKPQASRLRPAQPAPLASGGHVDTWARYLLMCMIILAYSILGGVLAGLLDWALSWGWMR